MYGPAGANKRLEEPKDADQTQIGPPTSDTPRKREREKIEKERAPSPLKRTNMDGELEIEALEVMDEPQYLYAQAMLGEALAPRSVEAVRRAIDGTPGLRLFLDVEVHPVADYFAIYGRVCNTIWAVGKVDRARNQYVIEFARPRTNAFSVQPTTARFGFYDFVTPVLVEEIAFRVEALREFQQMSEEEQQLVMRVEDEEPAPVVGLVNTNLFPAFRSAKSGAWPESETNPPQSPATEPFEPYDY